MTVENFVQINDSFWKKMKTFTIGQRFLASLGRLLVLFLDRSSTILMPLHKKESDMVKKHFRNFRSNFIDSIWENWKSPKMTFFVTSGLILAMFLKSQWHFINAIAIIGP